MIGKALLALGGMLGLMMLIPSDGTTTLSTSTTPHSALATSPELARFLDTSLAPKASTKTQEQVIAEMAAEPEPGTVAPVGGLALPRAPAPTLVASVAQPPGETIAVRSAVNMRSGPSTREATLSVLKPSEPITVLARENGWAKVQRADGSSGWVYASYLGGDDGLAAPKPEEPVRQARIKAGNSDIDVATLSSIRLRAGPSSQSQTILTVEPGTPLQIAEQRDGWLRVVLPDGVSGWIRGRI